MSFLNTLFGNEAIQALLVFGVGWVVNKIAGKKADTKAAKVANAIATSSAQMIQVVMTETGKTADQMLIMFKGIVAIQFGKVGISEEDRKPYQPMIDVAIATALKKWTEHHPAPKSIELPVARALTLSLAGGK